MPLCMRRAESPIFAIDGLDADGGGGAEARPTTVAPKVWIDWLSWVVYASEYGYEFGRQGQVGDVPLRGGTPVGDTGDRRALIRELHRLPRSLRWYCASRGAIPWRWPDNHRAANYERATPSGHAPSILASDSSVCSSHARIQRDAIAGLTGALEERLLRYVEHRRLTYLGEPEYILGRLAAAMLDPRLDEERYVSRSAVERILGDIAKVDSYVTRAIGRIRTTIEGVIRSSQAAPTPRPSNGSQTVQEQTIRVEYELRFLKGSGSLRHHSAP